jgi:hypothetical protein
LKGWYGEQSCLVSELPEIKVFKSSFFLRYSILVSENKKYILVKIRRQSSMTTISQTVVAADIHLNMPQEFQLLDEIFKYFTENHGDFGAVRPLAYLERWHALVMEEYQSVPLRRLIMQWQILTYQNDAMVNLLDAVKKAGRWLYLFHHKTHTISFVDPETEVMEKVLIYTGQLDKIGRGAIDTQSIRNGFMDILHRTGTAQLAVSQTHGDMTCDNILYSADGKVCAIDVKGNAAPVFSDLGLFLIHPETFLPQVFTLGFFFSNTLLRRYRKAVLEGYFGNAVNDWSLLNAYCSLMLLDKWVRYEDNATRYRGLKWLISRLISPIPKYYYMTRIHKYLGARSPADCGEVRSIS